MGWAPQPPLPYGNTSLLPGPGLEEEVGEEREKGALGGRCEEKPDLTEEGAFSALEIDLGKK